MRNLDLGQTSFNLVENAFARRQLTLLATRTFWLGRGLDEKVTYVLRLFDF